MNIKELFKKTFLYHFIVLWTAPMEGEVEVKKSLDLEFKLIKPVNFANKGLSYV